MFHKTLKSKTGTLHEDHYTFLIISHSVPLRMRNVADKNCRENQNKHFFTQQIFSKNVAIYETMQKNTVESDSPPVTIWCMHIACWIPKATNTHSEYIILTAFPLQEWLHLCTSVLTVYVRYLSCYARSEPTLGLCQDTVMFWFHNLKMKEV